MHGQQNVKFYFPVIEDCGVWLNLKKKITLKVVEWLKKERSTVMYKKVVSCDSADCQFATVRIRCWIFWKDDKEKRQAQSSACTA